MEGTLSAAEDPDGGARDDSADFQAAAEALARITHELKTPLVTIKGYAELLLDQTQQPLSPALRDWVRRIAAAANRLDALFRKVTGEARVEAAGSYAPQPVRPEEWIPRCVEEAGALAAGRSLQLQWSAKQGTPAVGVDAEAARDVLLELLQNAIRATPDGGGIWVETGPETRGGRQGARVTVRDSGVGIPAGQAAEALFDRFVVVGDLRAHHSGDFEFLSGGLGLGLSMVRGVARAHGGEAWAEGKGRDQEALPGAAFHIWLPAVEEPREVGPAGALPRGRLLVVDADPEARRILSAALADAYDVATASTAAEAAALWATGTADRPWVACVFDPALPDSSGVELARRLRKSPDTERAALLCYAADAGLSGPALRAAGVDACLVKPVRTRVLLQRLQAARGRRSAQ